MVRGTCLPEAEYWVARYGPAGDTGPSSGFVPPLPALGADGAQGARSGARRELVPCTGEGAGRGVRPAGAQRPMPAGTQRSRLAAVQAVGAAGRQVV